MERVQKVISNLGYASRREAEKLIIEGKVKINDQIAKIKGIITGSDIYKLKNGVVIDSKKTSPARVKLRSFNKKNNTSLVEITIHEGRNHQVKNMFKAVGYDVIKLSRIRFAFLDVKDLKSGEYRTLTVKEVKKLYSLGE